LVWHVRQNGVLPYMLGSRSLRGEALRANDCVFRFSSCIAGSSETISPFASNRFQQSQCGHRNDRGFRGTGLMIDWQKKHITELCCLNILDIRPFPRSGRGGRAGEAPFTATNARAMLLPVLHARRIRKRQCMTRCAQRLRCRLLQARLQSAGTSLSSHHILPPRSMLSPSVRT